MKIRILKKNKFWYWKLLAKNGQTLATSETYYSKASASRTAVRIANKLDLELIRG